MVQKNGLDMPGINDGDEAPNQVDAVNTPKDQIGGNSDTSVTTINNIVSTGSDISPSTGPADAQGNPTV